MRALIIGFGCEKAVRSMAAYVLSGDGFEVREATDLNEASAVLTDGFVPGILVVCQFDGPDGATPLKALKALPSLKTVPVLLIADRDEMDRQMEWKEAGVTGWVTRPFTTYELLEMARFMIFERPERQDEN